MISIAIQKDRVVQPGGQEQSFSARWTELASLAEVRAVPVDVYAPDVMEQIRRCDGFMWRYGYDEQSRRFAQVLLPAVERGLRLPVFPNWNTSWTFEDKVAQRYQLEAAAIPTPETWVFWKKEDAARFITTAGYPFVLKLSVGIRSGNVALVRNVKEASTWVDRLFGWGVNNLEPLNVGTRKSHGKHKGYFYAQAFLPDNNFDTRVTVIGMRAYAFRRFNREGDFRASGGGNIDWTPSGIDLETVRLAFKVAGALGTQSLAIDGMRRGTERVVGEVSYTYAAWAIEACPGHWRLNGAPATGSLEWAAGSLRAEDAIFEDFLREVQSRQVTRSAA